MRISMGTPPLRGIVEDSPAAGNRRTSFGGPWRRIASAGAKTRAPTGKWRLRPDTRVQAIFGHHDHDALAVAKRYVVRCKQSAKRLSIVGMLVVPSKRGMVASERMT